MYIYNPLVQKHVPEPEQLLSVLRMADDDGPSRDTRPLMSVLMRLRSLDPRLRGHILTRKTAITAFTWAINATEPNDIERAQKAQARLSSVIAEILSGHVQAPLFDVFCLQIEWALRLSEWTPIAKKRYKPVELEKMTDFTVSILSSDAQLVRMRQVSITDEQDEFVLDISDDDERGGLMRSIALRGCMQHAMLVEWGNFNRKLKGIVNVAYRAGADDDEINVAIAAAKSAIKNNFSVYSDDISIQVAELVKGSGSSFKEMIDQIQRDTCIAILGQANTAEVARGSGSRAALEVLNLIRADIHYDDMSRVTALVNRLILWDYRRNFDATATRAPWSFGFVIPEEVDLEGRVAAVTQVYEAGIALDATEAYQTMGFKRPANVGDILIKDGAGLP